MVAILGFVDQTCRRRVSADGESGWACWSAGRRLVAEWGAYEHSSEEDVFPLIRPVGWRRLRRFAGSVNGSGGVTPDPVTAIRAVTGSGVDAEPGGDRSLTHLSFFQDAWERTCEAITPAAATWSLVGESNDRAIARDRGPARAHRGSVSGL